MTLVNPRGFNRHWAVDIYRERVEFAGAEQFIQVIKDLLGASDGKRGDKDARLAVHSVLDDRTEFGESFLQGFVVAVAVSRFHKDNVGVFEVHRVPEDREMRWPNVPGKNANFGFSFFLNGNLDTCRPQHVPGINITRSDTIRGAKRPAIFHYSSN